MLINMINYKNIFSNFTNHPGQTRRQSGGFAYRRMAGLEQDRLVRHPKPVSIHPADAVGISASADSKA